jgi:hypothetical protein
MGLIRFVYSRRYRITYKENDAGSKQHTVEVNYLGSDHPGILAFGNRKKIEITLWREEIKKAEEIGEAIWR